MFGATLLFGINYWVAKGLMPYYLGSLQIIFLRVAGALFLFWTLEVFVPNSKGSIDRRDYPRIALAALLGITLNQILFFTGLNLTTPVDTALINSTNPLLVLVFSALLIRQSIKPIKIIGIIVGASGAMILVLYGRNTSLGGGSSAGNHFILANTICWSLYLVIAKPLMAKYHPVIVMRWIFLFGFLFAFPFTLFPILKIQTANFTLGTWGAIIYIIIGTTFLAYLFITYGLRRLSPSVVAFYTYLQPVIVAAIGISMFGQHFTFVKIVAA